MHTHPKPCFWGCFSCPPADVASPAAFSALWGYTEPQVLGKWCCVVPSSKIGLWVCIQQPLLGRLVPECPQAGLGIL